MNVVVDADVVIGALDGADRHHREARRWLSRWRREKATPMISVVNLTEVLVEPSRDQERLRLAREAIAALGITVHRPSHAIGVDAARLRHRHPLSLADAYCMATARHIDAPIASFDRKIVRAAKTEGIASV